MGGEVVACGILFDTPEGRSYNLRPFIRLLLVCLAALPLLGQNTPAPSAPPSPFLSYTGRWVDSASTQDWQGPHRTLRADRIKFDRAHDRIYVRAGGGYFIGYKLSTFTSRIGSALSTFFNGEQYLPFEMYVNPDGSHDWQIILVDGQDRLADFDFDSRGYIYLAYSVYGFGIVDLQGNLVKQIPNTIDPTPYAILTFASDGHQYVITSDGYSNSTLYDVTDPHAPQRIGPLGFNFRRWAKNAAGDAIAIIQSSGGVLSLQIYTPAALVSHGGGTAIPVSQQASGLRFTDVTSDGTDFYAAQDGSAGTVISTIAPSDQGYSSTEMPLTPGTQTSTLTFESGYLTWIGTELSGLAGTMYRYNGTQFESYDISSYLQANYVSKPHELPQQIVALCTGNQAFALSAADGLGDVFTLTPAVWGCLPAAPTDVTATAADSSATIYFSEPSDGGSPITSYTVTSSVGSHTATGTSSPITITGLTNGVNYTFTVTATNAVGTSVPSLPSNAATPGAALAPPQWFAATATTTSSVSVTWAAAAYAAHYELLRSSMGSLFTVIASPTSTSYTDTGLASGTTYLYMIRSVDSGGTWSATAPIDPATTIMFTDDPLVAGTSGKAVHIVELRTAVNAMRAAAGLGAATFTDPTLGGGTPIRAVHINELRAALDEARNTIGFGPGTYTDTIIPGVTPFKAVHQQELRNYVK
jgi:hypothetical protein